MSLFSRFLDWYTGTAPATSRPSKIRAPEPWPDPPEPAPVEETPAPSLPPPPPLDCLILGIIISLADEEAWTETEECKDYTFHYRHLTHVVTGLELSWRGRWRDVPVGTIFCPTMRLTDHESCSIALAIDRRHNTIRAREDESAQVAAAQLKVKLETHFNPLGCPSSQPTVQATPAQSPSL